MSIVLNNGKSIPWLAFGTGTALFGRDCTEQVHFAIVNGVKHLDGAQMYRNEDSVGAGIVAAGKPRSELFITTKLFREQTAESALRESLEKLGTDYVDLYLIHTPKYFQGRLKQTWKEMEEVQKIGLAKSIGVSNFSAEHLKEIMEVATVVPAVNQIEYHPYLYQSTAPIIEFCKKYNITVASYGGLTPVRRSGPLDPVLESVRERLEKTRGSPVTAGQVLMRLLYQQGIVFVTTTNKESRIKECFDALNVPELSPEEIQAISEAGSNIAGSPMAVSVHMT